MIRVVELTGKLVPFKIEVLQSCELSQFCRDDTCRRPSKHELSGVKITIPAV